MAGAEEYRFIMVGKSGSGKSTTGNTIFGEEKFCTEITFSSAPSDCDLQRVDKEGRHIEILECPGLYDTSRSQEEISVSIVKAVACMHPGPHAFLFVVRLGRFTPEEYAVYKTLKALFDEQIVKYMIIIITGGDDLDRAGKTLSDLLKSAPSDFVQVLNECGNRCLLFNNNAKNPKPQVEKLLAMVKDMIYARNGKPYSCPKYEEIGKQMEIEFTQKLEVNMEEEQRANDLEAKFIATQQALIDEELQLRQKEEARQKQLEEEQRKVDLEKQRLEEELRETNKLRQRQDELEKKMEEENQKKNIGGQFTTLEKSTAGKEKNKKVEEIKEDKNNSIDKERIERELMQREEEEKRKKKDQEEFKKKLSEFKKQMEEEAKIERDKLRQIQTERKKMEDERLLMERLEYERKELARQEEMNRMKDRLARNQEPNFLERFFHVVLNYLGLK